MALRPLSLAALLVLPLMLSAHGAEAARPAGRGTRDWSARPVARAGLGHADLSLASRLPRGTLIAFHPGTSRARFLAGTRKAPLARGAPDLAGSAAGIERARARSAALAFLDTYGRLFGVSRATRDLRLSGYSEAGQGGARLGLTLRFRQLRGGVPVLGGELAVNLGPEGQIISVAGEVLPDRTRPSLEPRLHGGRASAIAAAWMAREVGVRSSAVRLRSEGLAIHDEAIMGDASGMGARLVWLLDASVERTPAGMPRHRLVVVDAQTGWVVTTIERIAHLERRVCDARNRPLHDHRCRAPFARSEGDPPSGARDVDTAYRLMGSAHAFFRQVLGRDSIDANGAPLVASVRFCSLTACPMANAFWRWAGQQALFGRGWVTDDVVGHEITHGVVEHTADLFYHYQAGALNESIADVFGEAIDQRDPWGRDTPWTRWKIGEDTPSGPFRDMRDPPRYGHPDRVRSRLWRTGTADDGGVHRNSGVGNKAAFLVARGGYFNGVRVAGLGLERMVRIWYRALEAYLTPASDYLDLGDALLQSCVDLAGSEGITLGGCASVQAATRATEMHLRPVAGAPPRVPVCSPGQVPIEAFYDDMEDPTLDRWRSRRLAGRVRAWYYPQNPNNDPRWNATWASSGELNLYAADRAQRLDAAMTLRNGVTLPQGAILHFRHGFGFDRGTKRFFDGGVVEMSLDGGAWRDMGRLFTHGGYNGRIARGTGDPLAGRKAFTGRSRGYRATRADLSAYAGRHFRVRFRIGTDRSVGGLGWYVDDVRIASCLIDEEGPSGSVSIDDGAEITLEADVQLHIEASDAIGPITRMLVSNAPELKNGLLVQGLVMNYREVLDWSLTDPAWGGSPGTGTRWVHVQVRDAAGNWSAVFSDYIELLAEP